MAKTTIYENPNSKATIGFDGEIVSINQVVAGISNDTVQLYEDEFEEMYQAFQKMKVSK